MGPAIPSNVIDFALASLALAPLWGSALAVSLTMHALALCPLCSLHWRALPFCFFHCTAPVCALLPLCILRNGPHTLSAPLAASSAAGEPGSQSERPMRGPLRAISHSLTALSSSALLHKTGLSFYSATLSVLLAFSVAVSHSPSSLTPPYESEAGTILPCLQQLEEGLGQY